MLNTELAKNYKLTILKGQPGGNRLCERNEIFAYNKRKPIGNTSN